MKDHFCIILMKIKQVQATNFAKWKWPHNYTCCLKRHSRYIKHIEYIIFQDYQSLSVLKQIPIHFKSNYLAEISKTCLVLWSQSTQDMLSKFYNCRHGYLQLFFSVERVSLAHTDSWITSFFFSYAHETCKNARLCG